MNTNKYKSVVLDIGTYDLLAHIAEKNEPKSIAKTAHKYIHLGLSHEADEANLDSESIYGGTPRIKRLREDLEWFRVHAGVFLTERQLKETNKRYIINADESRALDITLATIVDCGG